MTRKNNTKMVWHVCWITDLFGVSFLSWLHLLGHGPIGWGLVSLSFPSSRVILGTMEESRWSFFVEDGPLEWGHASPSFPFPSKTSTLEGSIFREKIIGWIWLILLNVSYFKINFVFKNNLNQFGIRFKFCNSKYNKYI